MTFICEFDISSAYRCISECVVWSVCAPDLLRSPFIFPSLAHLFSFRLTCKNVCHKKASIDYDKYNLRYKFCKYIYVTERIGISVLHKERYDPGCYVYVDSVPSVCDIHGFCASLATAAPLSVCLLFCFCIVTVLCLCLQPVSCCCSHTPLSVCIVSLRDSIL